MINDKLHFSDLFHFSNINILDDIPSEILNKNDDGSISNLTSELQKDISGDEVEESQYEEKVEIIQQSAADDQENQSVTLNEPSIPENSDGKSSNSGTIPSNNICKQPSPVLMKKCNLDTRKIIFEEAKHILPFEFEILKDFPKHKFKNNRIRFDWIAKTLIENGLGK